MVFVRYLRRFIHISIQTEMMIHTDSNEREKNSIETSQRVKHTGTNSTRNDLASQIRRVRALSTRYDRSCFYFYH